MTAKSVFLVCYKPALNFSNPFQFFCLLWKNTTPLLTNCKWRYAKPLVEEGCRHIYNCDNELSYQGQLNAGLMLCCCYKLALLSWM